MTDIYLPEPVTTRRRRFEDWPERLESFLSAVQGREFKYGSWDCSLFGAEAVLAQTGMDFGAAFRGLYGDASSAREALKTIGKGDLESTVRGFIGDPLESPRRAQRGDLVLFESEDGDALGVVDLSGVQFAVLSTKGVLRLKLDRAKIAWRV